MKNASDKVGNALNDVTDDTEVARILGEAKSEAEGLLASVEAERSSYIVNLPSKDISEEKKTEFSSILTTASDQVKAKLNGVKIFADIVQLK